MSLPSCEPPLKPFPKMCAVEMKEIVDDGGGIGGEGASRELRWKAGRRPRESRVGEQCHGEASCISRLKW